MERDQVSPATREAEEEDASVRGGADREPTAGEEQAAEDEPIDDEVRRKYQDMTERGVNQQGEGRIT